MMTKKVYTTIAEIELDLEIDLFILDSHVYTTSEPSIHDEHLRKEKEKKYLCISINIQIENYDSAIDGAAYARPRFLIILGILSFLTGETLIPFEFFTNSITNDTLNPTECVMFNFKKNNLLLELKNIIKFLSLQKEENNRLFYSLIDRYRKAIYLEDEDKNSMTYDNEILLSYFHILELLSNKYYKQQKRLALNSIQQFTENILKNIYLIEGSHFHVEHNKKRKLVESIFVSNIPVSSKIMYMFQKQGLLTHRLKSFIVDIVKDRNFVSHGRQVYQENIIFPVPPFFPFIRQQTYSFEMLKILTGRAISIFIDSNHLKEEWENIDDTLFPTIDELNVFINEKKYNVLTIDEFYSGKEKDITPYTFTYHLLNNKLKAEKAIPILSNIILNYRENEDEISQIILAVILIVDSVKTNLKEKCIEIIKISSKNSWLPFYNMRDILYHLEYLGFQPKTLRNMLETREIK